MPDLRVAIIGYGLAGRFFHAPLIATTEGLSLGFVVTSSPVRGRQLAEEHPDAQVISNPDELWSDTEPDLVVVASPNSSHVELASAAIERGVAVVVDKPLANTADEAASLVGRASAAGVMLTVFQNRRWDTDQLTLRRLIDEGALGEVTRYESRFERWRPDADDTKWRDSESPERGGGVLLDLGSHLVDQSMALFGPATHVYAEIASRRGQPSDDDVFIALRHANGTASHLHASVVAPAPGPHLRVQGTHAGFVVPGLDPQEDALRRGIRPDAVDDWGVPPEPDLGRLVTGEASAVVPPEPGDWPRFYALVERTLRGAGPPPVAPEDAVTTLRVLEAARIASREQCVVTM